MAGSTEVPYLIVGAGPVGLTAARLLSNAGKKCVVVERRDGPQRNPAAHVVNSRTLEIFRQAGFDMARIADIAQDPVDAGHVNFVTRLNGQLIGRLPFERQGDEILAFTPHPLRNISQHRLEPLMSAEVGTSPQVDLRYDTEWVSAVQTGAEVVSVVRNVRTGEETTIHSSYLIGADGAGSPVRKSTGIEMVGPAGLQSFIAIHFRGSLRRYVGERLGALHFVMDPEVSGTFIAHDIDNESVFMVGFDPGTESIDDYGTGRCAEIVRHAIGDDTADVDVVGAGTWHMTAQVAERFRDGRVFLVGDAAHRFPPTGGMGLNTGVADAHNLVWKVLAVENGNASPGLLDTYESERRPIAETNCHQSLTNAFKMIILADALGLHPGSTSDDLRATLADPSQRDAIAAAVQAQATHFDMLGLQLGYVYETSLNPGAAVRPEDVDPTPFLPDAQIGSRLPHGWLEDGRSTLDLVATGSLTLLTFGAHDEWSTAMSSAMSWCSQVRIGVDCSADDDWRKTCGIGIDGALLVRPDQHVAWKSTRLPTVAGESLITASTSILGYSMGGPR
ncbi:MAG: FAD-dependent monooxygenase [Ilumatobacteraceae bacterium]